MVKVTRLKYQRGSPADKGQVPTGELASTSVGVSTSSQVPTGRKASVGVQTGKLSANQYQGGDVRHCKKETQVLV